MENIKEILCSLIDAVILYAVPALITIGILGALTAILWNCIDRVKEWRKKRKTYRQQHQVELRAKKRKAQGTVPDNPCNNHSHNLVGNIFVLQKEQQL